jgi:DNA end-binding protein Ku
MPRPVWSGSISFGLVNVPVKAFTAVRSHDIHFHQLEKKTGARIRNQKISDKSGKPVDKDDIEMGFEIREGRHVTFEKGEIDELRPESTKAVEVSDFVALEDIDPIYYDRTYWLAPADKQSAEPYRLLLAAMEDRSRVGIGTVVMRNKQYLTAIRPLDGALAMSTMRFADEVVPRSDIDGLPSGKAKVDAKAKKLAEQIVDSLTADWDPDQYHDTYTEELRTAIEKKDERGKDDVVESDEGDDDGEDAEVLDLMAALERSVSEAKAKRGGAKSKGSTKKASAKKAAPAKKATRKRAPAKKQAAAKKSA